jgi:hypothetical protein
VDPCLVNGVRNTASGRELPAHGTNRPVLVRFTDDFTRQCGDAAKVLAVASGSLAEARDNATRHPYNHCSGAGVTSTAGTTSSAHAQGPPRLNGRWVMRPLPANLVVRRLGGGGSPVRGYQSRESQSARSGYRLQEVRHEGTRLQGS